MKLLKLRLKNAGQSSKTIQIYVDDDVFARDPHLESTDFSLRDVVVSLIKVLPKFDEAIIHRIVKLKNGRLQVLFAKSGDVPHVEAINVVADSIYECEESEENKLLSYALDASGVEYWIKKKNMAEPLPVEQNVIETKQVETTKTKRPELDDIERSSVVDQRLAAAYDAAAGAINILLMVYRQHFDTSNIPMVRAIRENQAELILLSDTQKADLERASRAIDQELEAIRRYEDLPGSDVSVKKAKQESVYNEHIAGWLDRERLVELQKKNLIWLVYGAAVSQFKDLQRAASVDPKAVEIFNGMFLSFAKIEDGKISDLEIAYKKLSKLSLEKLIQEANKLFVLPANKSLTDKAAAAINKFNPWGSDGVKHHTDMIQRTRLFFDREMDEAGLANKPYPFSLAAKNNFVWNDKAQELESEQQGYVATIVRDYEKDAEEAKSAKEKVVEAFSKISHQVRNVRVIQLTADMAVIEAKYQSALDGKTLLRTYRSRLLQFGDDLETEENTKLEEIAKLNNSSLLNLDTCRSLVADTVEKNKGISLHSPNAQMMIDGVNESADRLRHDRESLEADVDKINEANEWLDAALVKRERAKTEQLLKEYDAKLKNFFQLNTDVFDNLKKSPSLLNTDFDKSRQLKIALLWDKENGFRDRKPATGKEFKRIFVKSIEEKLKKPSINLKEVDEITKQVQQNTADLNLATREMQELQEQINTIRRQHEMLKLQGPEKGWSHAKTGGIVASIVGAMGTAAAAAPAGAVIGTFIFPGLGTLAGALLFTAAGFLYGLATGFLTGFGIGKALDARDENNKEAIIRGSTAETMDGLQKRKSSPDVRQAKKPKRRLLPSEDAHELDSVLPSRAATTANLGRPSPYQVGLADGAGLHQRKR